MKRLSLILLSALLPMCVYADFTVGTVDMSRVLREWSFSKTKIGEIEARGKKKEQELASKRDALKATEKQLSAKPSDSKDVEEFRARARDFERLLHDTQDDLQRDYVKVTRQALKNAMKVIEAYAHEHNLGMVLDSSTNAPSPVLYRTASIDITEAVLAQLNK